MLSRLVIGVCLVAGVASARAELVDVPFTVGAQHFNRGDQIIIEQVLASSPALKVGDQIVVRGRYELASAPTATLGLFSTHRGAAKPDAIASSQQAAIKAMKGTFELSWQIAYAGDLHVSFYPAIRGESFGGVYFKVAAR
ncbi:MAG: hypothetical protein ABIZ04_13445 [Opitutus sp.]